MKAYWQTLVEALTLRRVIALPIMFSTVTVAMHLAPFLAREVNRPMLLGAPPWAFGVMSLLGLLCIFVIIYANRLRVSLLPSITLSCEPERGGLVQTRVAQIARDGQVLAQTLMATSIRVAVRAVTRIAPKNATAFVTKFEKLDTTGTWMASRYSELVQLPWVGETMTVDLSNSVSEVCQRSAYWRRQQDRILDDRNAVYIGRLLRDSHEVSPDNRSSRRGKNGTDCYDGSDRH